MFMNFPFFYNKNPLLIKSRKHQRQGENRYLKTFLGSPKPFIWTSCPSVSSLSSFKSESPNPDLYGISSVQLKQTDSPDHEMWNAFARLIPGSSKTYKSPPFSWRNNIRFPRQCLTSVYKPHFSVDFAQPINRHTEPRELWEEEGWEAEKGKIKFNGEKWI